MERDSEASGLGNSNGFLKPSIDQGFSLLTDCIVGDYLHIYSDVSVMVDNGTLDDL